MHLKSKDTTQTNNGNYPHGSRRHQTTVIGHITLCQLDFVCVCVRACVFVLLWQMRFPCLAAFSSVSVSWCPSSITNYPFVVYVAWMYVCVTPLLCPFLISPPFNPQAIRSKGLKSATVNFYKNVTLERNNDKRNVMRDSSVQAADFKLENPCCFVWFLSSEKDLFVL